MPGSALCVATLHPQDGFGDAGFSGDGESSHAAGRSGEGLRVYTNGMKGGGDHGGDEGQSRGGMGRDDPRATGAPGQLGKERRADSALLAGATVAVGAGLVPAISMKRPS